MSKNKYFEKQRSKLQLEAVLKSLLCGLAVGFGANFITALVTWFAPFNGLWLSLGVLLAATAVSTALFYLKRFRPTDMSNARRIDRLGLEERLITMVELSDNDSYIAQLQREDARQALEAVESQDIKLRVPRALILTTAGCALFACAMTTVTVLSGTGLLPDGNQILDSFIEEQMAEYVTISYVIDEGGIIEGDEDQIIIKGTNATTITAVADDGYVFKEWSDGSTDPTRSDVKVMEDLTFTAIFTEMEDNEEGDGDGDGEGEGDEPQDTPSDPSDEGQDGNSGAGEPGDPNDNSSAGGGAYEPNNQIINGETYYREVLESYQDDAGERIQDKNSGLSDAEKALIEKYLGIV